jgi:hypothetical protein
MIKIRDFWVTLCWVLTINGQSVAAQDDSFINFDWPGAKAKAKDLQRPRSFPAGEETSAIFLAARSGIRKVGFADLTSRLDRATNAPVTEKLLAGAHSAHSAEQKAKIEIATKDAVSKDVEVAQSAGFAALVSGSEKYRQLAMRTMLALATLDPHGESSVAKEDLSAMLIARTLALGLDWFHGDWTTTERRQLIGAISVRMEDFANKLVRGPKPLEKNLLVSHDNEVLGSLAEVAVLLLGDVSAADLWFDELVPLYARILPAFGGPDGGYANGTAYASWDMGEFSLRQWDTLRKATGLDLTKKLWAQNFGRYLAYFLPPGTPVGLFGDGTEVSLRENWARYGKAYANRVQNPLNRWYAAQWFQEDLSRLELLTSVVTPVGESTYPVGTANAAVFPTIGWVAMHSSLQDRGRTSLYFKSSPYGAVSHSHSDQNSFVLNVGGRQLMVDSGYYDYFGSPHHFGWTKRTWAHNAVTFDGGKGQDDPARPWGDETAKGKITSFFTSHDIDLTVGDATAAYRGQLKHATRGIVYLRPGVFIIFDSLESTQSRKWEWNVHALNKFVQSDNQTLAVNNEDAKACIQFQANTPTKFIQTNSFGIPPVRTKTEIRPDQWHGKFFTTASTSGFWSVAVVSTNCVPIEPDIRFKPTSITVRLPGRSFEFDGQKILVTQ